MRVREHNDARLTYSLRFRVEGRRHYITLGDDDHGWTCRKAERKLAYVLAAIRAGCW